MTAVRTLHACPPILFYQLLTWSWYLRPNDKWNGWTMVVPISWMHQSQLGPWELHRPCQNRFKFNQKNTLLPTHSVTDLQWVSSAFRLANGCTSLLTQELRTMFPVWKCWQHRSQVPTIPEEQSMKRGWKQMFSRTLWRKNDTSCHQSSGLCWVALMEAFSKSLSQAANLSMRRYPEPRSLQAPYVSPST